MQKKRFAVFMSLALVIALLLSACTVAAPSAAPAAPQAPAETAAAVKVGLVTDVGRVNDRSFNQSAWEGVVQAAAALGLREGDDYKYIETQDSKDYVDNIQQFVDAGFNVAVKQ